MRIRIQAFDDQKFKKIYSWKTFFSSKIAIYLSLGLHKGRTSYRRSLQPSKENILYICRPFLKSYRRSLQPSKENILYICESF
jgi:hypothetical protein